MTTRWLRVDETICRYSPTSNAASPVAVAMMCAAGPVCEFRMTRPRTNETSPDTSTRMAAMFSAGCDCPSLFRMFRRGRFRVVPATMTTSWL